MSVHDEAERPGIGQGLEAMRGPLGRAHHVPGYIYSSFEIFQLEKERIFMKQWLCVAREEEFERAGAYMTFRIMGEPVLVVRDAEGTLRAFANICAHRGVEVASGKGTAKEFMCPYHGWTYDLEGKLTGAAFMKEAEGFDPTTCHLPTLRLDIWAGWVFVCFDDDAPPLGEHVAEFDQAVGLLRQGECRQAITFTVDLDCNWKLVNENFVDYYHFKVLHSTTIGRRQARHDLEPVLMRNGGLSARPNAGPQNPTGQLMLGKLPWLEDQPEDFSINAFLPPTFHQFCGLERISGFLVWPLSPTRTRLVARQLYQKEHFSRPNFDEVVQTYRDAQLRVLEEDREMVTSLQRVMTTRGYHPGPLSTLESGVRHVINGYLDHLFPA